MLRANLLSQVFASVSASWIMICAGFHVGWSSPSLMKLQAPDSDVPVTSQQGSWIVSILMIGSVCGSLLSAIIIDRCGRKTLLLLSAVPSVVGFALFVFGSTYWWFYIGRFVGGLGVGLSYNVLPVYLGEVADARIRGGVGSMVAVMASCGSLIAFATGPYLDGIYFNSLGIILVCVFALAFAWVPESPYFLAMNDRPEEARRNLIWLRGHSDVGEEFKLIQDTVALDQGRAGTYKEIFALPNNRKSFFVAGGLMLGQQLAGYMAIFAYVSQVFASANTSIDPNTAAILMAGVQMIGICVAIFCVDAFGRRSLLLFSCIGSAVFNAVEAIYFQLQSEGTDVSSFDWLAILGLISLTVIFAIGLLPIPYVIVGEIFSCNVKAKASMLMTVIGSVGGALATQIFQIFNDAFGMYSSFWLFASLCVCTAIFVFLFVPETKRRTMHDIQTGMRNN